MTPSEPTTTLGPPAGVSSGVVQPGPTARAARIAQAQWPLAGALLLMLAVAGGALAPLLSGTDWWWLMAISAVVVLLGSAGLRRAGLPGYLGPLAGFALLVATLTLLFGAGTGWVLVIPTGATLDRFRDLVLSGALSIEQQSTPAEATAGILFLLGVGAGVIAILIDTLAVVLRVPALAGLPILVPLLVPGLVLDAEANLPALVFTAVAYLLLLRVEIRMREAGSTAFPPGRQWVPVAPGGTIVVGSIAIVAAIVASVVMPALPGGGLAGARLGGSLLFANGVSPMINLGQDLRRPDAEPVLHYRTTATRPPYLRMLTLDEFSGRNWTARLAEGDRENTVDDIALPPGLSPEIATSETITTIGIDDLATRWLPAPAPARSVTGLLGFWYWNGVSGSIASPGDTTRGQEYTVTALMLAPTADQLRQAEADYPAGVRNSLELPPQTPALIGDTAREVTAGTESAYDAALALQEYLRGTEFSYDTEAPVEADYDGGGVDVVSTFLEVKSGYCVHFSSAMAVMARSVGIPARIAIGYLPGALSASSSIAGIGRYSVDTHDLHAWTEVYFEGVGWVPFEPTPGRGSVPDYARETSAAAPISEAGQVAPSGAPRPEDAGRQNAAGGVQGAGTLEEDAGGLLRLGLLLVGAIALLLVPAAVRVIRRRLRRRVIVFGPGGAGEAWREVSDTAVDHGVEVRDTETPRELTARLRRLVGTRPGAVGDTDPESVVEALDRLLVAAERSRYARSVGTGDSARTALLAADLDVVLRGIRSGSRWRVRVQAVLLPASLWRQGEQRTEHPAANA
ncbi:MULTISPECIES: DUF3488 and transglutaminase-like domain-containing protein [Cryobacterium]|nr:MULTISPECIES: DUF3488 and transglutaminase-like domain-containing protein [Cryobacterium]